VSLLNKLKTNSCFLFSNVLPFSVSDEGYSRKALCALNLISTFLLLSLGRYLCWWTINSRGYYPTSSQCFGTDIVDQICIYYY